MEDGKVTWKSSNNSIATVNSKGKVTAKKAGTVTITTKANGTIAKCVVKIFETKRITATIKNNFPQQYPYYSTLIIKYGKNLWKLKFKDRFGEVFLMDLNGDGKDEIIVRLEIIGSTYGATEGAVYSVTDKGIVEILKITNENISRYISRAYACVDVLCHNNNLEIWGKTSPDIYKKISLKWNGKNWKY